jgi:hypothetical protein
MCIADISGETFVVDVKGNKIKKIFLRPNVAFELGLAYGFDKPSLILSREIDGQRLIPTDIYFIRYVDVTFKSWESVSQILADRLRGNITSNLIKEPSDLKGPITNLIKHLSSVIHLKENYTCITKEVYNIKFIICRTNTLFGIVKNPAYLKEDICFKLFISENGIESLKGYARVFHIQPREDLAQLIFYGISDSDRFWKCVIEKTYHNGEDYAIGAHRLELITPESLERISIEDIKISMDVLNKVI